MSLKAKIEAVIYASEEPVTLAQLIGLLGQEAQAELDRRDSQQRLPLTEPDSETVLDAAPEPYQQLTQETLPQTPIAQNSTQEPEATANTENGPSADDDQTQSQVQPSQDEQTANEPIQEDQAQRAQARAERDRARRLRDFFRSLLDELITDYASTSRGLEIREVASGFRLATKPEYHDAVRGFVKSLKPPLRLSLQALETLAVTAYKQPITAPEISDIRGVDSAAVLGSLLARKLITTAGRKSVIGRPILYKTTRDFLLRFGLKDLSELPSIEEFEKMATELAETDSIQPDAVQPKPIQEEIPMPTPYVPDPGSARPQPDGDSTPLTTTADMSPTPDGNPAEPPSVRLSGPPPASTVPGTDDDDPTESGLIARQNERDREERTHPQTGSVPSLQPK